MFGVNDSPVQLTKFSPNTTQLLSGSDDRTVKIWDIPSETEISIFDEHDDYVRSGTICPSNTNLILSGKYMEIFVIKFCD